MDEIIISGLNFNKYSKSSNGFKKEFFFRKLWSNFHAKLIQDTHLNHFHTKYECHVDMTRFQKVYFYSVHIQVAIKEFFSYLNLVQ